MENNLKEIGYIYRTHGYRGGIRIRVHEGVEVDLSSLDHLYLDRHGEQLPFFISASEQVKAREWLIQLEGVDSKESAADYKGLPLLAPAHLVKDDEKLPDYTGYEVFDTEAGVLGLVTGLLNYPGQDMLSVDFRGKELLIPFREELIELISVDEERIVVHLPEGFLDL